MNAHEMTQMPMPSSYPPEEMPHELAHDLERSDSIPPVQPQASFNDVPLADKRATVHLENGLPGLLRPHKTRNFRDPYYRLELEKRLDVKNKVILFICEFTGTVLFLLFSYGIATQASDRLSFDKAIDPQGPPDTSALLFSSLGFGFSLAVNAWIFFRVTGSLFNPALTLGLTLLGNLDWTQCFVLSCSQFLGGIAAAGLTAGLLPGPPNMRTTLGAGTTVNQGFWIEFFSTCLLLFTVYMLAGEKHKATFLAPVGIGLALFLAEMMATRYTGGSLNPARSLGPDVVAGHFDSFTWIYYVAPYCATLFTTAFYKTLVYFNYQTVVPDQDADEFGNKKQIIRDAYGNMIGALDFVPASSFGFMTAPEVDASASGVGVPPPSAGSGRGGGGVGPGVEFEKSYASEYTVGGPKAHVQHYGGGGGGGYSTRPHRKGSEATMYNSPYASSSRQNQSSPGGKF